MSRLFQVFQVVPAEGFEPPTFASEARRSDPLSYAGKIDLAIIANITSV